MPLDRANRMQIKMLDAMTIVGRVVDPIGEPVADALISQVGCQSSDDIVCLAVADDNGRYKVTEAPAKFDATTNHALLAASCRDYATRFMGYEKQTRELDFTFKKSAIIKGQVFDDVTGKPAANTVVMAHGANLGGCATTDSDGNYHLPIEQGRYNIWAQRKGRTVRAVEGFLVREGETRTAPDLHLIEGGFIEARFVDADTGQQIMSPQSRGAIKLYGPSRPTGTIWPESHSLRSLRNGVLRFRPRPVRTSSSSGTPRATRTASRSSKTPRWTKTAENRSRSSTTKRRKSRSR